MSDTIPETANDPAIGEARAQDDAAVVALWTACGLVRPWNDPFDDIRLCRESGHGVLLVARDQGRVVGAVMTGHDGHRGAVYYLGVDPAARRAGWGRRLVAAAEDWCRARGLPKINLLVRKENSGVLGFYEALGWRDTGCVCLYRALDPDKAEVEAAQKAEWAARVAAKAGAGR
ncbi:GNAT family acetyltransferase [Siculibacillus lacustris]|uniref:GNAT family acetyltransferase n=1 Tax=Siculibacillus lacustris TaxID=1549641 RepID=UPI001D17EE1A|nr:GNAT family acetyltransferase [Siculibacillus lacustris]